MLLLFDDDDDDDRSLQCRLCDDWDCCCSHIRLCFLYTFGSCCEAQFQELFALCLCFLYLWMGRKCWIGCYCLCSCCYCRKEIQGAPLREFGLGQRLL